jgi:hypothetical protein
LLWGFRKIQTAPAFGAVIRLSILSIQVCKRSSRTETAIRAAPHNALLFQKAGYLPAREGRFRASHLELLTTV